MEFNKEKIRNFSIIAHIDHGKSTLADRILEITNTIDKRKMTAQILDSMELEKEKKITIKLTTVKLKYHSINGQIYTFNLIDTPGHVDFAYEVSRSLTACEGVILVIDATRGIEAQTLANLYLALDNHLDIVLAINKIDLPTADIEKTKKQISAIGLNAEKAVCISAKTGKNIQDVLEHVISDIRCPEGDENDFLRALVFDSYYDEYRGVVFLIRIKSGVIREGDKIFFMHANQRYTVMEIGIMNPKEMRTKILRNGEVGYFCAQIKDISNIMIGETVTLDNKKAPTPLIGCKKIQPMVYAGVFPVETNDFINLKQALEKLKLNDASLVFEIENSQVLGFGFRCGFLGLLHMEIIKERLETEYNLNLILTAPNVIYRVFLKNSKDIYVDNPDKFPEASEINYVQEPYVISSITTPTDFIGDIMTLCDESRGIYKNIEYINEKRVVIKYEIPLSEIIFLFFDKLKSRTKGYANLNYEFSEYKKSDLAKIEILLNGKVIDAFSYVSHISNARYNGLSIAEKLYSILPRQLFEVIIQVSVNKKIIVRKRIPPLRKDVLAKCYGGDITRKKKLLEKQKEGKKSLKKIGVVDIPKEAFMEILSIKK